MALTITLGFLGVLIVLLGIGTNWALNIRAERLIQAEDERVKNLIKEMREGTENLMKDMRQSTEISINNARQSTADLIREIKETQLYIASLIKSDGEKTRELINKVIK